MDVTPHITDEDLLALDDAPEAGEQAAAAEHVRRCSVCQRRAAALRAFSEELLRTASAEDPVSATDAARARIRLRRRMAQEDGVPGVPLAWTPSLPLLAAALATLAAAVLITVRAPQLRRDADRLDSSSVRPVAVRMLPIRAITPGATRALSASELCARMPWQPEAIPASTRTRVLRAYGMSDASEADYELDYLVTPDLGGSPDARNLWPEPYGSDMWNARVKDELETLLPRLVCHGQLDLATAQRDIAVDWIAAYRKYFRTDRPIQQLTSRLRVGVESPFGGGD